MKRRNLSLIVTIVVIIVCEFCCVSVSYAASKGWANRPISVYADSTLTTMEVSQLKEAINAWNSTRFGTFFTYMGQKPESQLVTLPNIIAVTKGPFVMDEESGDVLARTATPSEGYVTKATIVINTNYTFNNGSTSSGQYYLKSVLMHELFHALGFKEHSIFSNSFFYKEYTGITSFLSSDIEKIDTLY